MEAAERANLIEELRDSGGKFCAEVSGLTEAQARYEPASDPSVSPRWSIEYCVEHVAMVEKGFFKRLAEDYVGALDGSGTPALTMGLAAGAHDARPEPVFRKKLVDRGSKMKALEALEPTGRYGSLAAALDRFRKYREETVAYLRECPDDLHARRVAHPLLGTLTCREAFLFMIHHPLRHIEQIREIKGSPGYPQP